MLVGVDHDLTLNVYQGDPAKLTWQSATSLKPSATVLADGSDVPVVVPLGDATERQCSEYRDEAGHHGQRARLSGLPGVDAELELTFAIDDQGELLLQIEQVGGKDAVQRITDLYCWRITPAQDAYMMVPRGSGYLIRADQQGEVEIEGFFGTAHSMPLFGIVCGDNCQYQIVDTWWDAHLSLKHTPGEHTVLTLGWEPSLGILRYARRVLIRFDKNADHVEMAKGYRQYLIDRGEFKTLKERADALPVLDQYLHGVEYRWPHWPITQDQIDQLLSNIRHFQEADLPISFFYPKWTSRGVDNSESFDGGWQGYVHPSPMPGGWSEAVKLINTVHERGCTAKIMLTPHVFRTDSPAWDPAKHSGLKHMPHLSDHYAEWMMKTVHDFLAEKRFKVDAMYFDGSAAYTGHGEHQGRTRRQGFEAQITQFNETRRRGIIPGAELARAWAIPACDFFFFTDWSSDRLENGEPVPVMPLVFHDCYGAHFSGGGYYNEGIYDWPEYRHPRLYELMYAAVPSHNWLPGGSREIEPADWGSDKMNRRISWLKKWHTYYRKVCYSEMTNHLFLSDDRQLQRVEFANGVTADFDLAKRLFRVHGIDGFSGDWEKPVTID